MKKEEVKFIYFKFFGKKQIQITEEQWEADWKRWHEKNIKSSSAKKPKFNGKR